MQSSPSLPDESVSAIAQATPAARYAGFWIRVVSSLLDLVLIFIVQFPMRMLVGSMTTILGEDWQMPTPKIFFMNRIARIGMAILLVWLYRAGMESSHFQGTLGKLAVQIKVTDLEGNRISFERATGRHLAKFLSALSLGVGYLMVGFTLQKQGLHDRIAGTRVLYR
ncbi:MAG: RDD family protein [Acidobacteria bacterium]|nr:RDD family protein [Acidobacteriota bacterium]